MKTKKWPTGGAVKNESNCLQEMKGGDICRPVEIMRHAHGRTSSADEMMDNKRLISALFVLQNLQLEC